MTVRLSPQEMRMFTAIQRGNRSDTVRDLIRRAFFTVSIERGCFYAVGAGLRVVLAVKYDG